MDRRAYDKRAFRNLPRERCAVADLFGLDDCHGSIHRHHVNPEDPSSRTIEVCNRHHQRVHAALRTLAAPESGWKSCPHRPGTHRYPWAKEACEQRLNRLTSEAA
jgi:hypothetical protein